MPLESPKRPQDQSRAHPGLHDLLQAVSKTTPGRYPSRGLSEDTHGLNAISPNASIFAEEPLSSDQEICKTFSSLGRLPRPLVR